MEENNIKNKKIEELSNKLKDESLQLTLENYKEQIKEQNKAINDLNEKNIELSNILNNNKSEIILDDYEKNDFYLSDNRYDNKHINNSNILSDNELVMKYKMKLKEYKERINSDNLQIISLKNEIKELKSKIKE